MGCVFENNNTVRERGWVWEMALSQRIQKSAKAKMMLTDLKPTFRLISKLFSMIFGRFSVQGGGSRRLSNPLSYIGTPIVWGRRRYNCPLANKYFGEVQHLENYAGSSNAGLVAL